MESPAPSPAGRRDIVVIGGSSGATKPLREILGALPANFPAAVFVVLHIQARSLGLLATVSAASSRLPVQSAVDGMAIELGNVYLGVPDHHLLIGQGAIRLGRGPRENMARPAVDALFRSAAVAYGTRVIGVVLSGFLNDGASGLEAIKRCGGLALVQDPADAIADEMPRSAIAASVIDHTVPGAGIGDILSDLAGVRVGPVRPIPPEIRLEVEIAAGERVNSQIVGGLGSPAPLTCPNCHGVLTLVREAKPLRFRCQVGHAYTADALAKQQEGAVDEALRVALRIMEERAELVARMAADGRYAGRNAVAELYEARAEEYRAYAETIRRAVLLAVAPAPEADVPDVGGANDRHPACD